MFGLRPWLAFLRRALFFFLFVRFDTGTSGDRRSTLLPVQEKPYSLGPPAAGRLRHGCAWSCAPAVGR